jgi:hypothetical protein
MIITLDSIKEAQANLEKMIAKFEVQKKDRILVLPYQEIKLTHGETYSGVLLGKDMAASHHLILIGDAAENINWVYAQAWALTVGGELPTRREQALLYANLKEEFKLNYYWSCEQHATESGYAWTRHFGHCGEGDISKSYQRQARAVRRIPVIQPLQIQQPPYLLV